MKLKISFAVVTLAVWSALPSAVAQEDEPSLTKRGEALLAQFCAGCHAIGRTGDSKHPQAPAFRTLDRRYPIENLQEALGEGLMSGHPDMPEFRFSARDVSAVIAYLRSIQSP